MITRDEKLDQKMRQLIVKHEGKRKKAYVDTVGKVTIGIGRNISDVGLSDDEVLYLFNSDIERIRSELHAKLPWIYEIDLIRQWVIIDMAFMGVEKLMGFVNMLSYLQKKDYINASKEMLRSHWAKQVGDRANDLARIMQFGVLL
jgi:lysozyme